MNITKDTLNEFLAWVRAKHAPKASFKYKNEDTIQKFIGWFSKPFNPDYMGSYITTIFNTIYWPSVEWVETNPISSFKIFIHELVHLIHGRKYSVLAQLSYIAPQILAIFSFLALLMIWFSPLWFLSLLSLLFLLPLPAYFRMRQELAAYKMSMAVDSWMGNGKIEDATVNWYQVQFTSSMYYWMWPFKANMRKRLLQARDDIYSGKIFEDQLYCDIHQWLADHDLTDL